VNALVFGLARLCTPRHRLKAGDMIASNEFLPGEVDYLIEGGRRRCRKRPVRGRSGDR
jgi:hypothetical protein